MSVVTFQNLASLISCWDMANIDINSLYLATLQQRVHGGTHPALGEHENSTQFPASQWTQIRTFLLSSNSANHCATLFAVQLTRTPVLLLWY